MRIFAGVDIGGTNTKIGIVDQNGKLVFQSIFPTIPSFPNFTDHPDTYMDLLAKEIIAATRASSYGEGRLKAVGIGVPGQVDNRSGIVYEATNLGWRKVPLAEEMRMRLGIPVWIDHDVRMIARGELNNGAGVGRRNMVCVALGTGVAAGIVIDGRVVQGSNYCAGEIGHDTVSGLTHVCNCGKVGCLETVASAPGIARLAEEAIRFGRSPVLSAVTEPITARHVHRACEIGDAEAIRILRFVAEKLGEKLAVVVALLDPELIVIGGGLARSGDFFLQPLRDYLHRQFPWHALAPQVVASTIGDAAGLLGSASYAAERLECYGNE